MKSRDLKKQSDALFTEFDDLLNDLDVGYQETSRVGEVIKNTGDILDDLDQQFCRQTGLTKLDMTFLFTAIGLQIARQYLLTKFPMRLDNQTAAKNAFGHGVEHSNRHHRYYDPSLEEIISNPVPFDANIGANGALSGGGKLGHRVTAIGHDPVLGLIFGTANIATATITNNNFESYHVFTNLSNRDYLKNPARTDLVLKYTLDKMLNQGMDGKVIVATSLIKEIIHLNSDINTKNSLPLPGISVINPQWASELAKYGLDMSNVVAAGKQASYAIFINSMIAMIHRMMYEKNEGYDPKLYEVRTRKILSYSNVVATSSNIAVVACTKNLKFLDLGGAAVTIYRLITDRKFIRKVKEDFIFGSYRDMIMGEIYE